MVCISIPSPTEFGRAVLLTVNVAKVVIIYGDPTWGCVNSLQFIYSVTELLCLGASLLWPQPSPLRAIGIWGGACFSGCPRTLFIEKDPIFWLFYFYPLSYFFWQFFVQNWSLQAWLCLGDLTLDSHSMEKGDLILEGAHTNKKIGAKFFYYGRQPKGLGAYPESP